MKLDDLGVARSNSGEITGVKWASKDKKWIAIAGIEVGEYKIFNPRDKKFKYLKDAVGRAKEAAETWMSEKMKMMEAAEGGMSDLDGEEISNKETGYVGIYRVGGSFHCQWKECGKTESKKFSIAKYGEKAALEQAREWRRVREHKKDRKDRDYYYLLEKAKVEA